ncbi:MAG: hypothetical protein ACRYGO_02280 [Janthinobacterium lividum]
MKNLSRALIVYLIYCSVMAFVDVDWDAESEQSAKASIYKQTLYMSRSQLQVYFDDLSTIDSAGMMGGARARLLDGKEVDDIHELANEIRLRKGKAALEFPSKELFKSLSDFVVIPFRLLMDR